MSVTTNDKRLLLSDGQLVCEFEKASGQLLSVARGPLRLPFNGITVDLGCNGAYLLGTLEFDSFENKNTWELPVISPKKQQKQPVFAGYVHNDKVLVAEYTIGPVALKIRYEIFCGALKTSLGLTNTSKETLWLNGLSFTAHLARTDVRFDFPANVPCAVCEAEKLTPWQPVQAGFINSAVHTELDDGHVNIMFVDPVEKWGSGVYYTGDCVNYAFVPALECMLDPGASLECGSLYIQPVTEGNPYISIREYFEALGYFAAQKGITSGVMYSCHPAGTMDTDFPLKNNLFDYAKYLDTLKDMGIDHVWLLPIFDHGGKGVYHSTDQAIVDERYGGDEATRYFCDYAHKLGMTVLFDYVPHGPHPDAPLAKKTRDWCARRKDNSLQIEWDCVSYDYNNPGYLNYTTELVKDHVERFGVDGARIDCAMGGLSNWSPLPGERPSSNSVRAGVNITRAIRDGFLLGGKQSFILPENFNPIPCYYPYTDLFYSMNLYRVFCELDSMIRDRPDEYVRLLTRWLEAEKLTMPHSYKKLRFLGNHDTVSWVWQAARATKHYGEGVAKALWAVITFIDGMPMIYQGDEDPSWYRSDGPVLTGFFKKLFSARKQWIGDGDEIEYLFTGTPVMAFIRTVDNRKRLVLVNLSKDEAEYKNDMIKGADALVNDTPITEDTVKIPGYDYEIFNI